MQFSCNSVITEKLPPDILSEKKIVPIIADLLILEAYTTKNTEKYIGSPAEVMQKFNYPLLNEKYGLKDSVLYNSYQFYLKNPEKFRNLMIVVQDTLRKREQKLLQLDTTNQQPVSIE